MNTELLPKLCPHSVFEYDCPMPSEPLCETCSIYLESRAKENERIADGIRSIWQEQANLSADWRG